MALSPAHMFDSLCGPSLPTLGSHQLSAFFSSDSAFRCRLSRLSGLHNRALRLRSGSEEAPGLKFRSEFRRVDKLSDVPTRVNYTFPNRGSDRLRRGHSILAASNADVEETSPPTPSKNLLVISAAAIQSFWRQMSMPLSNFGFGKRSIWEGGVGLFMVTGIVLLAITISWIKGLQVRSRTSKYQAIVEFAQACGITVGTPVRIRGVDVGSVVGVKPSLEKIDVVVEVADSSIVIPRNSLVEVNQSGLISETLIDITPLPPIPQPGVGPLDPKCQEEGLIVCNREHIVGHQGVSLDELVGICTKIAKQMDKEGVHHVFDTLKGVTAALEDYAPLLNKIQDMAHELQPMLSELREGELLRNLETLTKVASEATQDLRELNTAVLTGENTELLRQAVVTLSKTLKHIESISSDVSGLTGDPGTRYNLKQLIESLSRLVTD